MRELDLTAPIVLDDGEYDFLELRDGLITLRCTATGSAVVMHQADLAQRAVGPLPKAVANARLVTSVSVKQQERTLRLADHLREILTGEHPARKAPRPEYHPGRTQEQRIQAKLAELEATDLRISRTTLYNHLYAFKEGGLPTLVDGRAIKAVRSTSEDQDVIVEALVHVLAALTNKSTVTISRVIQLTWEEVLNQHGAAAPARPSDRTLRRLVKKYTEGRYTTASAATRRSAANRPDTPFAKRVQTVPGAEVQLDTTPMDVLVSVPGGKPQRPHLTIMLDVATRSILAFTIRLEAAKAIDHISLLAQALTPIQNMPDRTKFRQLVEQQNPGHTLLSAERLAQLGQRRPFIYPRSLTIDNGRDFKSNALLRAAETFGMNVVFSPPRTPTTKSHVERTFGAIATMFAQHLPGYVARSVEHRGLNVGEDSELLDIYALQELFHDWVLNVWQNRPHSALSDPLHPTVKFSPNQMAAAATTVVSTLSLPLTRQDYIGLLPRQPRQLRSTGFHLDNRRYDAPELHQYRGHKRSMDIHYDPYNPQTVWAKTPDGTFIECPIRDWDALSNPFAANFIPNGSALAATSVEEPTTRAEVALIGSALSGVPLHMPPALPDLEAQPTTFFDDDLDDVEELTE